MKLLTAAILLVMTISLPGDLVLSTSGGSRVIKGEEADKILGHWDWVKDRLREAESISKGTPCRDLLRHFVLDGGLHPPGQFRYTMILCPYFKVDVEFVDQKGEKVAKYEVPTDARVSKISKPYVQHFFAD